MPINLPDLRLGLRQINTGVIPNDGLGDDLRTALEKFNYNMNILAGSINESLSTAKNLWVAGTGFDTNNGLSASTPYKTLGKALSAVYSDLNLRGQQVVINVIPADYVEQVDISGLPNGGYSSVPILIKKADGYAGSVFWTLDANNADYCFQINNGAAVQLDGITFRSIGTVVADQHFIKVNNASNLFLGNCTFNLLSETSVPSTTQIIVEGYSELQLISPYTLLGGAGTHIWAKDGSYVWSPERTGDPKIVTVTGTVTYVQVFKSTNRSDVILDDARILYQGNLYGKKAYTDGFSNTVIDPDVLPPTTTAEELPPLVIKNNLTINGTITSLGTFNSLGAANFSGPTTFNGTATFNSTAAFNGTVTVPTQANEDNSTKVASTEFVQNVVIDKILETVPLATDVLPGLVKTDAFASDPRVYLKTTSDTLLALKAPLASPIFTGNPKAPTPSSFDNSTNIATTEWVRQLTTAISIIPTGTIFPYAGPAASVPAGWLICDGSYVSRTTYAALFAIIGTTWGTSDVSDFRLPNLVGRGLRGAAVNDSNLATTAGSDTTSLITANLPAHSHTVIDPGHNHTFTDPGHAHGVYDPGHNHYGDDAGHWHTTNGERIVYPTPGGARYHVKGSSEPDVGIGGVNGFVNTNVSGAAVRVYHAATGIAIVGAYTGGYNQASGTGIVIQNTGSGTAVNVANPHACVHYIIKG